MENLRLLHLHLLLHRLITRHKLIPRLPSVHLYLIDILGWFGFWLIFESLPEKS